MTLAAANHATEAGLPLDPPPNPPAAFGEVVKPTPRGTINSSNGRWAFFPSFGSRGG